MGPAPGWKFVSKSWVFWIMFTALEKETRKFLLKGA